MKKVIFCLIVLSLCFQIVSATDTTIQVKTVPLKNVNIAILQSGTIDVYEGKRYNQDADEYGDATFTFSLDDPYFDLTIFVKDLTDNSKVAYKKLESQDTGEEIYVEVVPNGFEIIETPELEPEIAIIENETINETEPEEIQEESPEEKPSISGKAIFGKDGTLKTILYILGGIILIGIIFFSSNKFLKTKVPKDIKVKKLSELKEEKKEKTEEQKEKTEEQKEKIDDYKEAIEDAQRKIKEAQEEINRLRNQDRIKEVEKRIEQEQKELKRLRGD